jgi:hypothetical protein
MTNEIDIRPPLAGRVIGAALLCVVTAIMAIASMTTFPGPLSWLLIAASAVGVFMFVRLFVVSLETRDGVLIVRNKFRTRRFRREDVLRFRPAHPVGTSWLEFLHVETTDASVPIDVLRSWTGGADRFAGAQAALEEWRSASAEDGSPGDVGTRLWSVGA